MATGDATNVAAAGRPQPQTTGEPAGGPFIRHSAPGRRPIYSQAATYGLYFGPKMVAAPGWYRGYKLKFINTPNGGSGGVISALAGGQDAPYSQVTQLQCKDAYGTNLFAGPGYEMLKIFQLLSGQYGIDETRSVEALPSWTGITAASGAYTFLSYLPFEFTQAYGVIAAANAALLPDLQMPISTLSTLFSTLPSPAPTLVVQNDADFYWLPNVPTDPPGQGTTLQCIYQPCNPPVPSAGSLRVQLPRLGGYLAWLGFDLRDSTGARVDAWPARPGIFVDSVELINSDIAEIYDDMAINFGIGGGAFGGSATGGYSQTGAATAIVNPRPTGIIAISRKTSLSQRDFGLLDTGEKFLSSNPGTQVEINGVPWGTISNTPGNLSAVIGQIVPSGRLIQGLPEV